MIIPPKYWPVLAGLVVAAFQLFWDATMYHNPVTQSDVAASLISGSLVFGFAQQCLTQVPPDEK